MYYTATITFADGNTRYEYGDALTLIRWASRYGVYLYTHTQTGELEIVHTPRGVAIVIEGDDES